MAHKKDDLVISGLVKRVDRSDRANYKVIFTDQPDEKCVERFCLIKRDDVLKRFNDVSKYKGRKVSFHYTADHTATRLNDARLDGKSFLKKNR